MSKIVFFLSAHDAFAYFSLKQGGDDSAQLKAVPGKKSITADYNGAKLAFFKEANRDRFLADPAKYAPRYDCHCADGASIGNNNNDGKVPGNRQLWRIVTGKLHVYITKAVVGFWNKSIPKHIRRTDRNWANIGKKSALTCAISSCSTMVAPL